MWSGPRNLSTAMMYSFGNRPDFDVMDEPFYAAYLKRSGKHHPMASEIIAAQNSDLSHLETVCKRKGSPHLYMKHMAHHMLEGFPFGWAEDCVHVHLIRHPARVVASYAAKREAPDLNDIGFEQQVDVFDRLGGMVIDGTDIRMNPEGMLSVLCEAIGVPFDPAMLSWKAGPRAQDGVWAKHWYNAVHKSTGFAGAEGEMPILEPHLQKLVDEAMPFYAQMQKHRLTL